MKNIFLLLICLIPSLSFADKQEETIAYYKAYNSCAPAAQNQTMKQCNYARLVENNYVSCMHENGFSDSEQEMDTQRYNLYLKTYRSCSISANGQAQQQCRYGLVYQDFYNQCMRQYGFNSQGDPIGDTDTDLAQNENKTPAQLKLEEYRKQSFMKKFFNSIL